MAEDNQTCAIFQRSQARILLKNVSLFNPDHDTAAILQEWHPL